MINKYREYVCVIFVKFVKISIDREIEVRERSEPRSISIVNSHTTVLLYLFHPVGLGSDVVPTYDFNLLLYLFNRSYQHSEFSSLYVRRDVHADRLDIYRTGHFCHYVKRKNYQNSRLDSNK